MFSIVRTAGAACLVAGLAACSTMSHVSSAAPGTQLAIKHQVPVVPSTVKMKDTSFGNYEFKAESDGHDALYGVLPLRFHGGRLALDILFFAPAAFFNLRGAFQYYEIDADKGVIRYKENANDPWMEYRPTTAERDRARQFFGVN